MHLCLAGAFARRKLLYRLKAPSVLLSFAEIQPLKMDKRIRTLAEMRENLPFIFCDSGAHSFSKTGERKASLGSPDDWFDDYLATMVEGRDYVDAWAELDIDGLEQVLTWREKTLRAGIPREKYVPVFHTTFVKQAGGIRALWSLWDEWCQEFPYVATEGSFAGSLAEGPTGQRRMLEKAQKHGAKLHSFASTSLELLRRVHFFSVASTSWLAGSMYGVTYKLDGTGRIVQMTEKNPHKRRKIRERIIEDLKREGVIVPEDTVASYLDDERHGVDYVNGLMFIRWEAYLTKQAAARKANYWEIVDALPAVYDEEQPCTCDSIETNGACKRHGMGQAGNVVAVHRDVSPETRAAISIAMRGNTNALGTGSASSRVPQVACDDCYLGDRCPRYKEKAACGYDREFEAIAFILGTRDHDAILNFLWRKLEVDAIRWQRGVFGEAVSGGSISKEVEGLSARLGVEATRLARMMGTVPSTPQVDARQVNLIIDSLSAEAHLDLLLQVAKIRDIAPELLEEPGED